MLMASSSRRLSGRSAAGERRQDVDDGTRPQHRGTVPGGGAVDEEGARGYYSLQPLAVRVDELADQLVEGVRSAGLGVDAGDGPCPGEVPDGDAAHRFAPAPRSFLAVRLTGLSAHGSSVRS